MPERFWFWSRAQRQNQWTVIVDMDQSGSMADSVVYGAVTGSIFASLPALNTRVVAFDTEVVDLTEQCGTQLKDRFRPVRTSPVLLLTLHPGVELPDERLHQTARRR